jgi:hypothetical protein
MEDVEFQRTFEALGYLFRRQKQELVGNETSEWQLLWFQAMSLQSLELCLSIFKDTTILKGIDSYETIELAGRL